MRGKKFLSILFSTLVIMSLVSGCNDSSVVTIEEPIEIYKVKEEFQNLKEDNENAHKEKDELNLSLEELKIENKKLKKFLEERTSELDKLKENKSASDKEIQNLRMYRDYDKLFNLLSQTVNTSENDINIIQIYGPDENVEHAELKSWIPLISSNGIEKNIEILAKYMENKYFNKGYITVEEIIEVDGKSVAVINLKEKESSTNKKISMWRSMYFAGSSGGIVSGSMLKLTFLQPNYNGEWIDGVKFLYEGNTLEMQHVELPGIIYREDIMNKSNYTVADFVGEQGKIYSYSGGFENGGFTEEIVEVKDNIFLGISKSTGTNVAFKYAVDEGKLKLIYTNEISEIDDINHWEQHNNTDKIILQDPIQIGTSWFNNSYEKSISMITDVEEKKYTKAGGIKDVVEVTTLYSDGEYLVEYYAKGVGLIKKDRLGRPAELIEIK